MLWGIDVAKGKTSMAKKLINNKGYKDHLIQGDSLELNWNNMPKFDVVVGNPPYQGKTYIDFLNLSYLISKKYVVIVHPALIYLHHRPVKRNKNDLYFRENIANNIDEITLFNYHQYFPEINLHSPMVISFIDKDTTNEEILVHNNVLKKSYKSKYKNIHYYYETSKDFISLKNKILSSEDNLFNHINTEGSYYVNIPLFRGNLSKHANKWVQNDFYTFFPKDTTASKDKGKLFFGFSSSIEANNFLNYLKTNFARFALSLYKITLNQGGSELISVPWLDFSKEWTDENLYKYFDLTKEEIKFIEDNIPKYY